MEAQRKLSELGESRSQLEQRLAHIEGRLEATQQPAPQRLADDQIEEWAVSEGAEQAAVYVLENHPDDYERYLRTWAENDPVQATRFDTKWNLALERERMGAELAQRVPQADPVAQQRAVGQEAWNEVKSQYPDVAEMRDEMAQVMEERPVIADMLARGPKEVKAEAFRTLRDIVVAQRVVQSTRSAAEAQEGQTAKATARVGTGSRRNTADTAKQDPTTAFKQSILDAPLTDIDGGLSIPAAQGR
jgi:hypothetical protein